MVVNPAERCPAVAAAIEAKFALLHSGGDEGAAASSTTAPRTWVNMGETGDARIYLSRDGHFSTVGEVLQAAFVRDSHAGQVDDSPSVRSAKFLDLGTAEGQLMVCAHEGICRLGWQDIVGISALDHRPNEIRSGGCSIPDRSYRILNIDTIHEHVVDLGGPESFQMIWSSATLYHLVDPVGAMVTAYSLLAPGGILLFRHLPLAAQCGLSAAAFSALLKGAGVAECCVWDMHEKPGLVAVCLRRPVAPATLALPLQYSGAVIRMGGAAGYQYATLNADLPCATDLEEKESEVLQFFQSLAIPVHDPEPLVRPSVPSPNEAPRCIVC